MHQFKLCMFAYLYKHVLIYACLYRNANLVSLILRKVYIIFIYKYWLNLCQCYFEEDKNYLYSYLVGSLQKFPNSNSSNISNYVNIVEITSTQHYTRITQNRFPEQNILGNNTMETTSTEVTSIRRRKIHVESSSIFRRF